MRILFIAPFGSCQKQTVPRRMLPLAAGLVARGHEVEVLIPAWDCPQESDREEDYRGVVLRYPRLGPAPHRLSDLLLVRRMLAAAKTFGPDLVHAFKPIGYSGGMALALRRRGYRVLIDVDDLETEEGWGESRSWPLRMVGGPQEGRVIDKVFAVSAASLVLRVRVEYMRRWRDQALYLPNGLYLAPTPAPVADNPAIVLLYTRGNDVSAERVARLWSAILERAPGASLRIVGDWAQAPDLPRCEHLGWLKGEALVQALRGVAVAWFPVRDTALVRAKSPGRLLDCLAQGVPIVTEDVGEYGALIGSTACQVSGDDDGLVTAAVGLLTNIDARVACSRYSWQHAQRHTWQRRLDDLLAWYEHILM